MSATNLDSKCFQPVSGLAKKIRFAWEKRGFTEECFTSVAHEALASFHDTDEVNATSIAEWLASSSQAHPPQFSKSLEFGNPPVTLYIDDQFLIDAYFWMTAYTSIHNHKFTGAFKLISGETLECRFSYASSCKVSGSLDIGELVLRSAQVLHPGDVVGITAGDSLIHSTIHLSTPSITLCVRTQSSSAVMFQNHYIMPGIRLNSLGRGKSSLLLELIPILLNERCTIKDSDYWRSLVAGQPEHILVQIVLYLASSNEILAREVAQGISAHHAVLSEKIIETIAWVRKAGYIYDNNDLSKQGMLISNLLFYSRSPSEAISMIQAANFTANPADQLHATLDWICVRFDKYKNLRKGNSISPIQARMIRELAQGFDPSQIVSAVNTELSAFTHEDMHLPLSIVLDSVRNDDFLSLLWSSPLDS